MRALTALRASIRFSVAIALGAMPFVSPSLALAGTPGPIPLRVVSYNLKQGFDGTGNPQWLQAGNMLTTRDVDGGGPLRGLNPDVLLLQECNQANFAELSAFRDTFLPGYDLRTFSGDGFNFNTTLVRPGISVISSSSLNVGGPRGVGKTRIRIPGALKDLIVYNAHFKSGSAASDVSLRTANANASANDVSFEVGFGTGNVLFAGDLNSPNNSDGALTNLFLSGVKNLPIESLSGAANPNVTSIATFPSFGSRLDYICLDAALAAPFDLDSNGSFSQAELNAMGYVYYAQDDAGLRCNGDPNVTNFVSDHRPVVFNITLPRDPNVPAYDATDVSQNGTTDVEDLYRWESAFALTAPPLPTTAPDVDGDRHTDQTDGAMIRTAVRAGEVADVTTF